MDPYHYNHDLCVSCVVAAVFRTLICIVVSTPMTNLSARFAMKKYIG